MKHDMYQFGLHPSMGDHISQVPCMTTFSFGDRHRNTFPPHPDVSESFSAPEFLASWKFRLNSRNVSDRTASRMSAMSFK